MTSVSSPLAPEPMTAEPDNKFSLFPIKYTDIWSLYKKQEKAFWVAEEIDYPADLSDWDLLSADEKYFVEHVLAFFSGADNIVIENLMSNFSKEIQWPEIKAFYCAQSYIEQVHAQTYSHLIDVYIKDPNRKTELFNAIQTIPCVTKKANWALKWMNPETRSLATRMVAFAVIEGVFFSGSFCAIFWLKSRGLMVKALGHSNELIARDETMHCNFAIHLYNNYIVNKLNKDEVHQIFKQAVDIETEFISHILPHGLDNMNCYIMTDYIKYVANYWLDKFNYEPLYPGIENPFSFMILNDLDGKTNFFEKRVSEYNKSYGVSSASSRNSVIDENF
jgi:ribonucleoside-diphosphate reductase beta chain